jgi:hypothetical protein
MARNDALGHRSWLAAFSSAALTAAAIALLTATGASVPLC